MENKELVHKWLNGEASPAELEALKKDPVFAAYANIDARTKQMETPEHDIYKGLEDLKTKRISPKKKVKIFRLSTIIKIAAIFALLAMSYVFVANIPTTVGTPMAETTTISLPDASRITLNENSNASYNKYGWPFNRTIQLEGEAFFEVAKGKTFRVATALGDVTVLGTKFNVSIRDNVLKVSCYEGLVAVTRNGTTFNISPGDSFTFSDLASTVNNKMYISHPTWIFNESSFINTRLGNVLMAIENQYGVTINTQNIDVDLQYTGTFTHNNLENALRTVTVPLNLSYRKNSKNDVLIYDSRK
ncbi:MAG: ferric-dicitrate binding protein FerR (iron transport regulator) [Patiriisocius sp.]|jgi:ferric-dicitrate binding protein FerR (iron transport regulator)